MIPDKINPAKESQLAIGRKKLDLPVQRNVLTNYFCILSSFWSQFIAL